MASETKDLQRIRRGCTNKEMRKLILDAIATGARYKMVRDGVMILGENRGEAAVTHFSGSDHRAAENFRKLLKAIGITIEKRK